jgi:MFS family permease
MEKARPEFEEMPLELPVSDAALQRTTIPVDTLAPQSEIIDGESNALVAAQDTGLAAWKGFSGGILFNTILAGEKSLLRNLLLLPVVSNYYVAFPLTFGVFQEYLHSHTTFGQNAMTAWIGVLAGGLPYLGAPLMTYLCRKYNFPLRYYLLIGWSFCIIGLVSGAFCKSLPTLIITQGACYGIGISILDVPTLLILNTWFLERRGLAYGILFATTDLVGFILCYIANALLSRHGFKTTLLVFAALIFVIPGAGIWLFVERVSNLNSTSGHSSDYQADLPQAPPPKDPCGNELVIKAIVYYRHPFFYILSVSNIFQAFAFYIPFIYLPSYAVDLGCTSTQATTVLAVANLAQVIGELCFGKISDIIPIRGLCVLGSSLGASLATLLLWGFARSYSTLIIFGIVYGAFASGLIALWARIGMFFGEEDAQSVYSVMSLGRGIGNVASGPISAALISSSNQARVINRAAYGLGKYQPIIFFVGSCTAFSAVLAALGYISLEVEDRIQRKKEISNVMADVPQVLRL